MGWDVVDEVVRSPALPWIAAWPDQRWSRGEADAERSESVGALLAPMGRAEPGELFIQA